VDNISVYFIDIQSIKYFLGPPRNLFPHFLYNISGRASAFPGESIATSSFLVLKFNIMKPKRLSRFALFAGLAGFVWSLLAIDPVVRSGRNSGKFAAMDDAAPAQCKAQPATP
jgi:hypothetical protein